MEAMRGKVFRGGIRMTRNFGGVAFFTILILAAPICAFADPVPDTGQTRSYTTTFGEDHDYAINPPSYTKLDPERNELSDSATVWAMVRDKVTGLIWEVKTDDGSIHDKDKQFPWYDSNPETNGGHVGTRGAGPDTEEFIRVLNDVRFGGFSDWRLPTVKELAFLVDYGRYRPAIDTAYFPNTISSGYWSSTTNARFEGLAWSVYFFIGNTSNSEKSDSHYVRAVRGGP
jgi:hypothetical protein